MNEKRAAVLAYKCPPESRLSIETALEANFDLTFQNDPLSFQTEVSKKPYDIIFLNFQPENGKKFKLLEKIQEQTPFTPVIITCESEDCVHFDKKLEPIIYDILNLPLSPGRVKRTVRQALYKRQQENELAYLRRTQDIVYSFDRIIAESESFKAVIKSLKKFASTDATILITGNTGTGKSFLSGTVHHNSPRHDRPFIKINCANIPETLLESELFGHEKGSLTGADKQRIGRFEQADGGTIFLDEIGEIPLEIQSKLLRVLEDKSFERVGGNKTIKVDVRLVAATNRDLKEEVEESRFREDLYYRLNVVHLHIPPLRERPEDIPPLATHFLRKYTQENARGEIHLSPEAMKLLLHYAWPGNVRELENVMERAVILCSQNLITVNDFPRELGGESLDPSRLNIDRFIPLQTPLTEALEQIEEQMIRRALEQSGQVQVRAAELLGITKSLLQYKLKKYHLTF